MIEERVTETKGVEGMHLHAMCTMWHTRLECFAWFIMAESNMSFITTKLCCD